eukprot:2783811-Prymnesium_polylepis.1
MRLRPARGSFLELGLLCGRPRLLPRHHAGALSENELVCCAELDEAVAVFLDTTQPARMP